MNIKFRSSISTKYFTNPLFVYALAFILILLVYSLKWSSLYRQEININLLLFVIITSLLSIFLGKYIKNKNLFIPIPQSRYNFFWFIFILLGNIIEFIYCKTVPFLTVTIGGIGNYRDFKGIPMFHVLLVYIMMFFGVYAFHQYLSSKYTKKLLFYALSPFVFFLLTLNRGALIYMLLPFLFLWLLKKKRVSIKIIIVIITFILLFFFLFGRIGNMRDNRSSNTNEYILNVGAATHEFRDNNIPKEFFWGYLYVATPFGNLQNIINSSSTEFSFENFVSLVIITMFPDFISKRLDNFVVEFDDREYLVKKNLNAPTVFYFPYWFFGWIGMILMFLFMIYIVFIYVIIINKYSVYFLTGWSFLLTIILLNTFNNMWSANGLMLVFMAPFFSCFNPCIQKKIFFAIPNNE
jgi:oligosaccharide repeat unit polymerase